MLALAVAAVIAVTQSEDARRAVRDRVDAVIGRPDVCGEVETAKPKRRTASLPPLAIGDSVMLLALPDLTAAGFAVDAHGCRQFTEGIEVIRERRLAGRLPRLVVVALGADAAITEEQIAEALDALGAGRTLGLVVPLETDGVESEDATVVRSAGKRFPGRVRVLDWPKFSRGHRDWFQPDHLHLTYRGAAAYARLISRAREGPAG